MRIATSIYFCISSCSSFFYISSKKITCRTLQYNVYLLQPNRIVMRCSKVHFIVALQNLKDAFYANPMKKCLRERDMESDDDNNSEFLFC